MKPLSNEMQQCIDNCYACVEATRICLKQHIGEKDMERCLKLSLDCGALVAACAELLATQSEYVGRVCGVCAELCRECADECAKFDSEVCKQCAEKCRECADSCAKMAA